MRKTTHSDFFFVRFELDEEFNETIKSRFRDEFSYASFSEGEKMRINLAILFTWRAVAKLRNSVATNLLIMDEVMDSSLDVNGTEEFLKKFINEQGRLLPRRITGNSLKFQRKVSDAVKKARQMALLPYVTDLLK